jgi:hypothetical protein
MFTSRRDKHIGAAFLKGYLEVEAQKRLVRPIFIKTGAIN